MYNNNPKTDSKVKRLLELHDDKNIAESLDEEELNKIGAKAVREFNMDEESRSEWKFTLTKAMDIAKQTWQAKNTPWEKSSNIKFPLITNGAIQFAARTYPELIQDGRVVEAYVSGDDPDGRREQQAKSISAYMSYQLLVENKDWESDTDRLLHMLPIVGTVFRKTYYDPITLQPCSELCDPDKIVIHNSAKSVESVRRVSHVIQLYSNDVVSRVNAGIFLESAKEVIKGDNVTEDGKSTAEDDDKLHDFIEQHRFLDLDDDGYQEPYIVTVHFQSQKVVKIVSRWDMEGIKFSDDGEIIDIKPVCYFTDYHFIPSPDGSFYSLGFGVLLYPINDSINTLFNQLIDAGTASNMQSGFIGSGLRIEGGEIRLRPGEWKKIPTIGNDIQANIFPMPMRDPSQTLFNLLQALITTGKELTGVIDIMPEDQQTQNVPATTILSLLDQRLKPLKAIFKRIYRSFKKEFEKLYRLNSIYLPDEKIYFAVLNNKNAISKADFIEPNYGVKPIADPSMSSESQRLLKVQALRAALSEPGGQLLNPMDVMTRWVKELNLPNSQSIMAPPQQPQPDPKMLAIQQQAQDSQNAHMATMIKLGNDAKAIDIKGRETAVKESELHIKAAVAHSEIEKHKAQSLLDIAIAKNQSHNDKMDHILGILDTMHKSRDLDIKHKKVTNDNNQSAAGMEGSPSNSQDVQTNSGA